MAGKIYVSRQIEGEEFHKTVIPNVIRIYMKDGVSVYLLHSEVQIVLLKDAPKLRLKKWLPGSEYWEVWL